MRCDDCKYRELEGHEIPCLNCEECGIPYLIGF